MQCKSCDQPTVGQSRYCRTHRAESRARFKEMVAEQAAERAVRYDNFAQIWEEANQAGLAAADAAHPTPIVVQQHSNMLDDGSPVVKEWVVPGGVCGFAWVTVRPGNSSFARWTVKNKLMEPNRYSGGVQLFVHVGGQSMGIKEAYADAFAAVLRKHDIKAYSNSRMD